MKDHNMLVCMAPAINQTSYSSQFLLNGWRILFYFIFQSTSSSNQKSFNSGRSKIIAKKIEIFNNINFTVNIDWYKYVGRFWIQKSSMIHNIFKVKLKYFSSILLTFKLDLIQNIYATWPTEVDQLAISTRKKINLKIQWMVQCLMS